jgi:SAM-dependent methyltransferase
VISEQREPTVRAAYDIVADTYADEFPSTGPETPIELAMITHFASLLPGQRRVLDAGCGAGRMLPVLAGLGCEVEGVDLSPGMIRRAQRDHGEFRSQVASLSDLPFSAAAFDGVFSWYSTIHSPDGALPQIFSELRRVLRSDGLVLVGFQTGRGIVDVAPAYRPRGHEVALVRYPRAADEMGEKLAAAGFREVGRLVEAANGAARGGQAVLIATPA